MEIFDNTKSLVENLYLLSGPIIAIIGSFVIYQLYLAKKAIKLSENQLTQAKNYLKTISKREAASIAAKRVEFFIAKIIPLGNKIHEEKEKSDIVVFKGKVKDFNQSEFGDWTKEYQKFFFDLIDNNRILLGLDLINYLEGFAVYFTKGIGDEKIAFSSIGSQFCDYVETYYPSISFIRTDNNPNKSYDNLVELYEIWSKRLKKFESEELIKMKEKMIQEEQERLKSMKDEIPDGLIDKKPIGV